MEQHTKNVKTIQLFANKNSKAKRTNKTLELQAKYYEVEDFKWFMIEQWILGYSPLKYYLELSTTERYNFISWLIVEKPHKVWQSMVLYLLNPNSKRNNGNRI